MSSLKKLIMLFAGLFLLGFCVRANATTLTVTSLADSGTGTLRGQIAAASPGSTIDFSVSGTITLTSGEIMVTKGLTISGPGANVLTISGNNSSRVFNVRGGYIVGVSGLTIAGGNAGYDYGAGIYNFYCNLTVSNCTLAGNNTVIGGGGAIYNYHGTTTLSSSTLSGNSAGYGAGIYNDQGTVTVSNSTLFGNSTTSNYGGFGGGIYNVGTLTVSSSTLSGNSAHYNNGSNGLGGGIYNDGYYTALLNINNSIVANSTGGNFFNTDDGGTATFNSGGYNLSDDAAGGDGTSAPGGFLNGTGDIRNTNPLLSALADNGGPTATMALVAGSPAIDAGNSTFSTDQRGISRPIDNLNIANATGGNGSDIGAFESPFVLPTLAVNNPRSLPEGSAAAAGSVTFAITLSAASTQNVTVNYQTTNGSNNPATAGVDYMAKSGKLTFAPGETLKKVTISFIGDSAVELNETFFFDLKTPTNATIADSRGVGQINNDDGPGITIDNAITVNEGSAGTSSQIFTVHLSAASTDTITVDYVTADQTAIAASDYVAQSGTLIFAPGETSKLITIQVNGDTTVEPNETYKVVLSKVTYAFIADGLGSGTIRNDDATPQAFQDDEPSQ